MPLSKAIVRISLAAALLGSLAGCTVVPAYPPGYRAPPVVIESYPGYRYGYPNTYYEYDRRYYDGRGGRYYRDERRYEEPRRIESPLEGAERMHRDIRRSLGLPRLPGMP